MKSPGGGPGGACGSVSLWRVEKSDPDWESRGNKFGNDDPQDPHTSTGTGTGTDTTTRHGLSHRGVRTQVQVRVHLRVFVFACVPTHAKDILDISMTR